MDRMVEVIKKNTLRRFGHVMKRGGDYVTKVALSLKMTGKSPIGRLKL